MNSNNKGFTLLEIMVALGIMAVGFLAMSQMQFLALRQHGLSTSGTIATNITQSIVDRDLSEIKRIHLLNSRAYLDSQSGLIPSNTYCSAIPNTCLGSSTESGYNNECIDFCRGNCPCDPLMVLNTPTGGTGCVGFYVEDFDPSNLEFLESNCTDSNPQGDFFVVRRSTTNINTTIIPNEIVTNVVYSVKTPEQFENFNLSNNLNEANSVVLQRYSASAHIDDWSNFIPSTFRTGSGDLTRVVVPHIP